MCTFSTFKLNPVSTPPRDQQLNKTCVVYVFNFQPLSPFPNNLGLITFDGEISPSSSVRKKRVRLCKHSHVGGRLVSVISGGDGDDVEARVYNVSR